jgi:hypothetical protein
MTSENAEWLSVYFFYAGNNEDLLANKIKPFVAEKILQKEIEQFFFIRYWERGPHLRLRFQGKKEILENKVKAEIELLLKDYLSSHPSANLNSVLEHSSGEADQLLPNNSVHYFPYEPEYDRYGGKNGIPFSEKQFNASSDAVLSVIAEEEAWDYDTAMGVAIQMHLSFAHAMGMNLKDAAHFYSGIFLAWLYLSYDSKNLSREEHVKKHTLVMDAFEDQFAKQSSMLVPFHGEVWNALEINEEFESDWLNKWFKEMKVTHADFSNAQQNNLLEFPDDSTIPDIWQVPAQTKRLWFIYSSYVHMTNNRLGILNRDEAFLGYLIKRSLEVLNSQTNND